MAVTRLRRLSGNDQDEFTERFAKPLKGWIGDLDASVYEELDPQVIDILSEALDLFHDEMGDSIDREDNLRLATHRDLERELRNDVV